MGALWGRRFTPNQLQGAHSDDFIFESIIELILKLKKFPTSREMEVEQHHNSSFPSKKVFQRLGTKGALAQKIIDYCKAKGAYGAAVEICESALETLKNAKSVDDSNIRNVLGEVYLFKSGHFYKIGKTVDTVRRGSELRIQLPEKVQLIHSIKTDDPSGIEAYWHRRFEMKRLKGEWFDLSPTDVKAFKSWRRIA